MRRYLSNPLDTETDEAISFGDVTLLALIGAAALVVGYILFLGTLCATHRLEAAVLLL